MKLYRGAKKQLMIWNYRMFNYNKSFHKVIKISRDWQYKAMIKYLFKETNIWRI
jgi:hypothetical protein